MKRILLAAFILLVSGCARETNITGEIFIVTRGGQNYKLGLVTVGLIPRDAFLKHLESETKIAMEKVLPIYSSMKRMRDSINSLHALTEDLETKQELPEISKQNR